MATPSVILEALDAKAATFDFAGFNNANFETVDARLHCFRDGERWALVIEQLVDWPGTGGACAIMHAIGDTSDEALQTRLPFEIEDEDENDPDWIPASVQLRGKPVSVDREKAKELADGYGVSPAFATLHGLCEEHRDALFATPAELASCVAPGLVSILTLEEWSHPDVYGGPKPSESEAFRQLAEVLATGDVTRYAPTKPPNSRDWLMWLRSH